MFNMCKKPKVVKQPSTNNEYTTRESIRYHINVAGVHKVAAVHATTNHGRLYRLSRAKYHLDCAERLLKELKS